MGSVIYQNYYEILELLKIMFDVALAFEGKGLMDGLMNVG